MHPGFTDDSMIRVVHRERAVGLGGPRALLLMAAHPVAFEGFFASTGDLDDPYARLRRTADLLDVIGFGDPAEAQRATKRVQRMHAQVRGTIPTTAGYFPAGTPYAADDPELLLWVLACLVDSSLLVFERYVRPLSPEERDAYWRDYLVVGDLFGLSAQHMPEDWAAFQDYWQSMLHGGQLYVTPRARALGRRIVMAPPVPLLARPLVELANQITIDLLPRAVRRGFGLRWDPLRATGVAGGAQYIRRLLIPLLPEQIRLVPSARAVT